MKAKAFRPAQEDGAGGGQCNNETLHLYSGLLFSKPFSPRLSHPLLRAILCGRKAGVICLHLASEETKSWDREVICSRSRPA